jgi:formate dehydrogenase major subunit/formate dehydrogenase alpha subunit
MYYLQSDHDKFVGIEPSTVHSIAKGHPCVKGWNAFQFIHHPDRLTTPLIRKNGVLEAAGWEEALDLVVHTLPSLQARYGHDSIMFFSSARTTNEENYLFMKLARAVFKTNNVDHCARLCHSSSVLGLAATFGSGAMSNSISCVDEADTFFVIGSNTTENHPQIGARILQSVKRGAKLIVADSRTIRLAKAATLHLRHRNGSDVALINGMMHVIIRDGLENREFIESRTQNYEQLKNTVLRYPPSIVAEITGLTPQEIIDAAHLYATSPAAMIIYSVGITQHTHGVDNVRSLANLAMLTGHVGRPGTGVNPLRGQNNVQGACDMGALPNVFSGYQKVADEAVRQKFVNEWRVADLPAHAGLPMTRALNAAERGEIKGLYIVGEDPVISDPDQGHVRNALQQLDFLVVQDIFLTATAEYADVVLPAACFAEKDGTFTSTERRIQRVRKAALPIGGARADWEIFCEIASRAGYKYMHYNAPSEIMDEIARVTPIYGGISYSRIDQIGLQWPCLDEHHPGTPILHVGRFVGGMGCFCPAEYRPPAETPDAEYPFILTTGRSYFHYHTGSMTRRTRLLEREENRSYVEINPVDAHRLGIRDRDFVMVATRRGEIVMSARMTKDITPGVLFITFHFEESPGNLLTNNALDPESHIPEYKVCAARITRKP